MCENLPNIMLTTQQARDIESLLGQCWADVVDRSWYMSWWIVKLRQAQNLQDVPIIKPINSYVIIRRSRPIIMGDISILKYHKITWFSIILCVSFCRLYVGSCITYLITLSNIYNCISYVGIYAANFESKLSIEDSIRNLAYCCWLKKNY